MVMTITGENVLLEGYKYDALCTRAAQAMKYEQLGHSIAPADSPAILLWRRISWVNHDPL